jgi:hypothetical protein
MIVAQSRYQHLAPVGGDDRRGSSPEIAWPYHDHRTPCSLGGLASLGSRVSFGSRLSAGVRKVGESD